MFLKSMPIQINSVDTTNTPPNATSTPQSSSSRELFSNALKRFRGRNSVPSFANRNRMIAPLGVQIGANYFSSSRAMLVTSSSSPSIGSETFSNYIVEDTNHSAVTSNSLDEDMTFVDSSQDIPILMASSPTSTCDTSVSSTTDCTEEENVFSMCLPNDKCTKPTSTMNNSDMEDFVMVTFDKNASGSLKIVNDPHEIKSIKEEEEQQNRNAARLQMKLSQEPWYTCAKSFVVNEMLSRAGTKDGHFLIRRSNFRSSQDPNLVTFALTMTYQDNVKMYRILQKCVNNRTAFTLDNGISNFGSLPTLVEFYQLNQGILPCVLTECPLR
jgi:hypothetical protein